MDTLDIFYMSAIFHGFIVLFGHVKYRAVSATIFVSCLVNIILVDVTSLMSYMSYVEQREFWIWYNGCTALFLCLLPRTIIHTIRHAIVLIFAVLCHLCIIWELTKGSNIFSYYVYEYYESLIITAGILQMWVSIDGFTNAYIGIRDCLRDIVFYRARSHQNFIQPKRRED